MATTTTAFQVALDVFLQSPEYDEIQRLAAIKAHFALSSYKYACSQDDAVSTYEQDRIYGAIGSHVNAWINGIATLKEHELASELDSIAEVVAVIEDNSAAVTLWCHALTDLINDLEPGTRPEHVLSRLLTRKLQSRLLIACTDR